jgi:cyclopropane-fatty-acyl-phospholipid synthase
MVQRAFEWAERGLIPDPLVRFGIRRMLVERLRSEDRGTEELRDRAKAELIERLRRAPIAEATADANEQHYEVPAELFRLMLGPRLKYSSCYWPNSYTTLAEAEDAMLALTCDRAELADGQRILELGCGWGSLTLWMAERYPKSTITAVSNSSGQREVIEEQCELRRIGNVQVVTADMNDYEPAAQYDRVISVEMFEHMRNYERLMHRIASWLVPDGKLFVHIFCHRSLAYLYDPSGPNDWMAREFFTGGTMPSADLLTSFRADLTVEQKWHVCGTHYQRTLEAWLRRLDTHRDAAMEVLSAHPCDISAERRFKRWRLFLLACSELFGYRKGTEWRVSHYRFHRVR